MNTQKIIQDVNQFSDVNIDCITRQLGEKYVVGDYMEYFDFTKTLKGAGILNSNLGLANIQYSNLATYLIYVANMRGYSGRLAVYNIQWTPGDPAFSLTDTIPANYADDTTRFRNAFGTSSNIILAGVMISYQHVLYEAAVGNIYIAVPPGTTINVGPGVILFEKVTDGLFNYFHEPTAAASYPPTGVQIQRWDGSYYLGYITQPPVSWASVNSCFVSPDNIPLHNANYPWYSANNIPAELQRINIFSSLFFHFPAVSVYGQNDARPGGVHFFGKRWQPVNLGTIASVPITVVGI